MTKPLETIATGKVPVNTGKLLENQLMKWKGGGHHSRGIAEYITNSDDSYRRMNKFSNQNIIVEIHSITSKKIEKLKIQDFAEGMSYSDLENKFFQYFESFSGREKGEKVTGRFGTGGKAYAIMNFRHCWITSIQNNKECKAWFKWDGKNQEIIKGYNNGGYKDKYTTSPNGTTITLDSSIQVTHLPQDLILQLEKLARIRHILKSQRITFKIYRRNKVDEVQLKYSGPDPKSIKKDWEFDLPESLRNSNEKDNKLILRYFEKPLYENAFIDLTDGISTVADLMVFDFDGRQFSKYINGSLTVERLLDSVAVKENRRGLEEGDDLTEEIKDFLRKKVNEVVNEVEELQRQQDKDRRINAANEKLSELSKFLSKQDLKFRIELTELKKRFSENDTQAITELDNLNDESDTQIIYRKPLPEDPKDSLVRGTWVIKTGDGGDGTEISSGIPEFIFDNNGKDFAIKVGKVKRNLAKDKKQKQGILVLMSNNLNDPQSPTFKEYDDPVSDRDLVTKGIIWINAVHTIIVKFGNEKVNDTIRNENIANFVLMIIAQYYAQKEVELQPEEGGDDPLLLFRKHFFRLQMELRLDDSISYFDKE